MTIAERLRRGIGFADLWLAVLFVVLGAFALTIPASADTYWHLRTGADILATGAVPRVDSYSFTAAGWPWRNHEWLWEPLAYACYRAGGMPLMTICGGAFVIASLALVVRLTTGSAWTRFALLLVAVPLAMPLWVSRPHLFTLAAIPLLLTLLARDRLWPIPPLFLLWANVHGGVALGGVLLGVATALALLRWRLRRDAGDRRRALVLLLVLPLAALACLATPLGLGIFHFLVDSMARIKTISIGEWLPTGFREPYGVYFWVLAGAFCVLVGARHRAFRAGGTASAWADWVLVASALVLFPFAIVAVRNAGVFALVAIPAASRLLGPAVGQRLWARRAQAPSADHPIANLVLLAATAAAALIFVGWSYRARAEALGWRPIDERALAAIRACEGPLYNQYDDGGYLIWFVPERPVFVDNRQDPYPIEHIQAQISVQWEATPYRPLFERWGIRCAFLPVGSSTVKALERDGWDVRYRDERFVVLSAPSP
jgi:hypothetical protein